MINKLPKTKLEVLSNEIIGSSYVNLEQSNIKFIYDNGSVDYMKVDSIVRKNIDAVVILAYFYSLNKKYVYLRSAIRPSLDYLKYKKTLRNERKDVYNQWELPAGLIEENEVGMEGVIDAAVREVYEELGFIVKSKNVIPLGNRVFSSVGLLGERLYFVTVEVNPEQRKLPVGDGSALEKHPNIIALPVQQVMEEINCGNISDIKTEIGISRFKSQND